MTNEKKKTVTFTIILAVVAILLMTVFTVIELRKSGIIGSSESGELIKEFKETFNSKKRTLIYYASSTCSYCELQLPILETIAEDYDLDYFAIDSNELGASQRKTVLESLGIEHATPTTVIVEKGKVVDTQIGFVDGKTFIEFLKKSEMIPSDAVYSAEKNLTLINYDEYKKIVRGSEKQVITIGQTTCPHCIAIKSALNSVVEDYGLKINYLNMTELTPEESEAFFNNLEKIGYDDPEFLEDGSFGTPLTIIVKNGKIDTYISGARTISQLVREFTKAGLIEE